MSLLTVRNIVGFTKPPKGTALFFAVPMALRKVDELVVTTTVTNSTAETSLGTMTLPAVTLTSQGAAAFLMAGTVLNTTNAGGTVRLRSKIVIGGVHCHLGRNHRDHLLNG